MSTPMSERVSKGPLPMLPHNGDPLPVAWRYQTNYPSLQLWTYSDGPREPQTTCREPLALHAALVAALSEIRALRDRGVALETTIVELRRTLEEVEAQAHRLNAAARSMERKS